MSTLPWHPCAADSSCGDGYGGKTWVKGEGGIGSHDHSYSTHPIDVPMCSRRFWTYPYHHTHTYTHTYKLSYSLTGPSQAGLSSVVVRVVAHTKVETNGASAAAAAAAHSAYFFCFFLIPHHLCLLLQPSMACLHWFIHFCCLCTFVYIVLEAFLLSFLFFTWLC